MKPRPPRFIRNGRHWTRLSLVRKLEDGGLLYRNDLYTVALRHHKSKDGGPDLVHLAIHVDARDGRHDWSEIQRIKNEIVGAEHEMIELYPAESRREKNTREFHLWGFDSDTFRMPFGFGRTKAAGVAAEAAP